MRRVAAGVRIEDCSAVSLAPGRCATGRAMRSAAPSAIGPRPWTGRRMVRIGGAVPSKSGARSEPRERKRREWRRLDCRLSYRSDFVGAPRGKTVGIGPLRAGVASDPRDRGGPRAPDRTPRSGGTESAAPAGRGRCRTPFHERFRPRAGGPCRCSLRWSGGKDGSVKWQEGATEHDDLRRELDLADLRRRNAEADRHGREAEAVRTRLWLDAMKWAVAARVSWSPCSGGSEAGDGKDQGVL